MHRAGDDRVLGPPVWPRDEQGDIIVAKDDMTSAVKDKDQKDSVVAGRQRRLSSTQNPDQLAMRQRTATVGEPKPTDGPDAPRDLKGGRRGGVVTASQQLMKVSERLRACARADHALPTKYGRTFALVFSPLLDSRSTSRRIAPALRLQSPASPFVCRS